MAKTKFTSVLDSIQGKIDKEENICFRRTPSGGNSIYLQHAHTYASLHSNAQERHRKLIAQASASASLILSDPSQVETYRRLYDASDGKYSSLRHFIIHLEYTRLKSADTPSSR